MDLENKRVDSDFGPLKLVVKQGWGYKNPITCVSSQD